MKRLLCCLFAAVFTLTAVSCAAAPIKEEPVYKNITAEEAKHMMDTEEGYAILDVRTEEEFAAGHIEGAVLIPDYEIEALAPTLLPDKSQTLLVYCRSGRRSKLASEALVAMGYTSIYEFGGIIDWPYDLVTD